MLNDRILLLAEKVVDVLATTERPLTIGVIEAHITIMEDEKVDTFDVRDALSYLLENRVVYCSPLYTWEIIKYIPPTC